MTEDPEALNNRGVAWAGKGEYAKAAAEDYSRAISTNPEFSEAYYNRGVGYSRTGKTRGRDRRFFPCPGRSIPVLRRHFTTGGWNIPNWTTIREHLKILTTPFRSTLNIARRSITGVSYLARKGRSEEAISDYSRAITLDPRFVEAYFNRGIITARSVSTRRQLPIITRPWKYAPETLIYITTAE